MRGSPAYPEGTPECEGQKDDDRRQLERLSEEARLDEVADNQVRLKQQSKTKHVDAPSHEPAIRNM